MIALEQTMTVPPSRRLEVSLPDTFTAGMRVICTIDVARDNAAPRQVDVALYEKQMDECQEWAKEAGFTEDQIPGLIKEARRKMHASGH
jgi:hypothetical protein